MKFVIDTNIIIASLIRNGKAREILFNKSLDFISPSYALSEIYKYRSEIMKKANINELEFDLLLSFIFEKVKIINQSNYEEYLPNASNLIKDKKDISFLALAISEDIEGIWSDDLHFKMQNEIKVFNTKEMIHLINELK